MIGSLKVIHTPGHTPGHISLYCSEDRLLFGADVFYKNVFGPDHMYISHQDSPLVERANETIEQLVSKTIEQINAQNSS
jgi:glyoxylase-like metal-dependent hydrolase (beta-lactamase superfamily II)